MKNRFQLSATNFSMLHDVFIHEFTRQNFDQGQGGGEWWRLRFSCSVTKNVIKQNAKL